MAATFVLLQHGSHGAAGDLTPLRDALATALPGSVEFYQPSCNEGLWTDEGIAACTARLELDLIPRLEGFVAATAARSLRPRLAVVGHSFGGIICRAVAARVAAHPALASLDFAAYCSIATPHCGVLGIHPALYYGAWAIGRAFSQNYLDLILKGDRGGPLATTLVDDHHIAALRRFDRRVAIGNTKGDILVPFRSACLGFDRPDTPPPAAGPVDRPNTPPLAAGTAPSKHVGAPFTVGPVEGTPTAPDARISAQLRGAGPWDVVPVTHSAWRPTAHDGIISKGVGAQGMADVVPALARVLAQGWH